MRKLTAFKVKGLTRHKEEFLDAISKGQLSEKKGMGFIVQEDSVLFSCKFVEKVVVKEEVFDLVKLDFLPVSRETVMVCSFLVDLKGGWLYINGPMSNAKAMMTYLVEATANSVSFEPCTLSLPRVFDMFIDKFGDFEVIKVRVNKIRLNKNTAFTGDLLPRGWSNDRVIDLAQHWRSLTVMIADGESEGKVTVTRNAAMSLPAEMWALNQGGWAGLLAGLVRASKDDARQ
ncbi:MAG: hypothetical protein GXP49_09380 [Deltaproteobacteria bacterium]|nr:hypothetical protein [Deltaproteobacteria bacterium]